MSLEPHLVFLQSKTLGTPGSVERFMQAFRFQGYEVADSNAGSDQHVVGKPKHGGCFAEQAVAHAYKQQELSFDAYRLTESEDGIRFEVSVTAGWGERHLGKSSRTWVGLTCFQTALFNRSYYDTGYYSRLFLDLGKALYSVLQPIFGWLDFCQLSGFTGFEDVEILNISHIYWANYFGPDYVSKLGFRHLMTAPAWSVESLNDGGILYVLGSCPGAISEGHVAVEDVRRHFGVPSVR